MSTLSNFLLYIKNPNEVKNLKISKFSILKLWSLVLVISFGAIWVSISQFAQVANTAQTHALQNASVDFSILEMLILSVFMAPIIEEIAFRLPLKLYRRNLNLSIIAIALILFPILLDIYTSSISIYIFIFLVLVSLLLLNQKDIFQKIQLINSKNLYYGVYFSSLSFGLLHVFNYNLNAAVFLLIIPQILLGFLLSYIRIQNKFVDSILLHALHNAYLLFLGSLSFIFSSEQMQQIADSSSVGFSNLELAYLNFHTIATTLSILGLIFLAVLCVVEFMVTKPKS